MLLMVWAQARFSGDTHIIETHVCACGWLDFPFLTWKCQYDTLKNWADNLQRSSIFTNNKLYAAAYKLLQDVSNGTITVFRAMVLNNTTKSTLLSKAYLESARWRR
jgi:hypothetical protein